MANYIKATDFSSKDNLLTSDPLKIVSGTEIDNEFNAIQTAVNTKANSNSPALTGVPTAPTATAGTNTTQIATTAFVTTALTNYQSVVDAALQAIYPVGSIYTNATNSTNPATLLGFGTWVRFGEGRVLVSQDSTDTDFNTAEETGGSKTTGATDLNLSVDSTTLAIPRDGWGKESGVPGYNGYAIPSGRLVVGSGVTENSEFLESIRAAGGDNSVAHTHTLSGSKDSHTHTNLPPYITVYMWKRTA